MMIRLRKCAVCSAYLLLIELIVCHVKWRMTKPRRRVEYPGLKHGATCPVGSRPVTHGCCRFSLDTADLKLVKIFFF